MESLDNLKMYYRNMILETEKSHDLLSTGWRIRKDGGLSLSFGLILEA